MLLTADRNSLQSSVSPLRTDNADSVQQVQLLPVNQSDTTGKSCSISLISSLTDTLWCFFSLLSTFIQPPEVAPGLIALWQFALFARSCKPETRRIRGAAGQFKHHRNALEPVPSDVIDWHQLQFDELHCVNLSSGQMNINIKWLAAVTSFYHSNLNLWFSLFCLDFADSDVGSTMFGMLPSLGSKKTRRQLIIIFFK